jgi:hypothetical protein
MHLKCKKLFKYNLDEILLYFFLTKLTQQIKENTIALPNVPGAH